MCDLLSVYVYDGCVCCDDGLIREYLFWIVLYSDGNVIVWFYIIFN